MATQRQIFDAFNSSAQGYKLESYEYRDCGCQSMRFQTGGHLKESCDKHKYEIPRSCPCGLVERLTHETSLCFRVGDLEGAEALRKQRIEHFEQCYEKESAS